MKKVLFIIFLLCMALIINNLLRSIYSLWHKGAYVTQAKQQLAKEQTENQQLKTQLSLVTSQGFVEEEARNRLFLSKPGEEKVLIDPNLLHVVSKPVEKETLPVWRQWANLFWY